MVALHEEFHISKVLQSFGYFYFDRLSTEEYD